MKNTTPRIQVVKAAPSARRSGTRRGTATATRRPPVPAAKAAKTKIVVWLPGGVSVPRGWGGKIPGDRLGLSTATPPVPGSGGPRKSRPAARSLQPSGPDLVPNLRLFLPLPPAERRAARHTPAPGCAAGAPLRARPPSPPFPSPVPGSPARFPFPPPLPVPAGSSPPCPLNDRGGFPAGVRPAATRPRPRARLFPGAAAGRERRGVFKENVYLHVSASTKYYTWSVSTPNLLYYET